MEVEKKGEERHQRERGRKTRIDGGGVDDNSFSPQRRIFAVDMFSPSESRLVLLQALMDSALP